MRFLIWLGIILGLCAFVIGIEILFFWLVENMDL